MTLAAAARLAGVTPMTIRVWIRKGWLAPEGGWTATQLQKAAEAGRQTRGRGSEAEHGTTSRWRAGCPCDACTGAHNAAERRRREDVRVEQWRKIAGGLFSLLAAGEDYGSAIAAVGVTAPAVTAHRRRSTEFAANLDAALMAGRDPLLTHGTSTAWKTRCRCPECRNHHEATR